jgi:hypothetical protein
MKKMFSPWRCASVVKPDWKFTIESGETGNAEPGFGAGLKI